MKKRSKFSLSHYKLATMNMGKIVPVGLTEVLPGDTLQQATSAFIRVTPLAAPVMHPVHVSIHHWYVPLRLIWDDFESFITGGEDGLDDSVYPTITAGSSGFAIGSLADYLGVPTGVANLEVSALPFRAYDLIYNEWYRDENLVDELVISTESGADTTTSLELQAHAWKKDYFTAASPWPQKGPAVTVPVDVATTGFTISPDGTIPSYFVYGSHAAAGGRPPVTARAEGNLWNTSVKGNTGGSVGGESVGVSTSFNALSAGNAGSDPTNGTLLGSGWVNPGLKVDANADIGSIDINKLREAFALQRFEEHRALYGSRYTEYLRYLGIRASDARLQRPEYLGGGRQTIQFSEVLQTAEGTDPVGTMRGHGIAAMRTNRYRRFIEEHGLVLTFMMVQPIPVYAQGLPRLWNRRFKEDFWQKELEHIGEQEVLNKELYAASEEPDGVFGYQDRYDEYRSHESSISGEFRDTLDYWHMARIFDNQPVLNQSFVYGAPTNRVFMEQTQNQLYCMINHSIQARRLVSRRGNPI